MNNHVVTKETAILLRDAGFPQNSQYFWVAFKENYPFAIALGGDGYFAVKQTDENKNDIGLNILPIDEYAVYYAAPLATEILGELRNGVYILCAGGGGKIVDYVVGENFSTRELWSIALAKGFHRDTTPFELRDKNLSEGLAKMYIYLKKNNLI